MPAAPSTRRSSTSHTPCHHLVAQACLWDQVAYRACTFAEMFGDNFMRSSTARRVLARIKALRAVEAELANAGFVVVKTTWSGDKVDVAFTAPSTQQNVGEEIQNVCHGLQAGAVDGYMNGPSLVHVAGQEGVDVPDDEDTEDMPAGKCFEAVFDHLMHRMPPYWVRATSTGRAARQ